MRSRRKRTLRQCDLCSQPCADQRVVIETHQVASGWHTSWRFCDACGTALCQWLVDVRLQLPIFRPNP